MTFCETFEKHFFGYTAEDYLDSTFKKMKATYGLQNVPDRTAYRGALVANQNLAFEAQDSVYCPVYSNQFIKVDFNLNKYEYQARNGQLWSRQNPYRPEAPSEDEEALQEHEAKLAEAQRDIDILGTSFICTSNYQVLSLNGDCVRILAIGSRENMAYITRVAFPNANSSLIQPRLGMLGVGAVQITLQPSQESVSLFVYNLDDGKTALWSQNLGHKVHQISHRKQASKASPVDFLAWATQNMSIKIFNTNDIA